MQEEAFDKTQKYKEGKYILERHGKSLYPLEQASKGKGCPLSVHKPPDFGKCPELGHLLG